VTGRLAKRSRRGGWLLAAALALALGESAGAAAPAAPLHAAPAHKAPALRLEAGSVAYSQLVALGRDLVVAGEARSDVAALQGTVEVSGHVAGDVIVLGGEVRLAATGQVDGDVSCLGGSIVAAPGARIGGRSVSYPSLSSAWLTLLEGPTLGLAPFSSVVMGAKLALLAAWALLLLLFFVTSGRGVLETAAGVRLEPFRSFVIGLNGVLSLFLTGLFFATITRGVAGVPLLVLVVFLALVLKLWGTVAVFYALGDYLSRRLLRRRLRPLNAATLGLLVLGAVKFLPVVGVWAWTAATLIGIGAALASKFGRHEPWLDPA
jgi:hypothetical protein